MERSRIPVAIRPWKTWENREWSRALTVSAVHVAANSSARTKRWTCIASALTEAPQLCTATTHHPILQVLMKLKFDTSHCSAIEHGQQGTDDERCSSKHVETGSPYLRVTMAQSLLPDHSCPCVIPPRQAKLLQWTFRRAAHAGMTQFSHHAQKKSAAKKWQKNNLMRVQAWRESINLFVPVGRLPMLSSPGFSSSHTCFVQTPCMVKTSVLIFAAQVWMMHQMMSRLQQDGTSHRGTWRCCLGTSKARARAQ